MTHINPMQKTKTILLCLFSCCSFQHAYSQIKNTNPELIQAAKEWNKSCPIAIDKNTRLDSMSVASNNVFNYHYTLVGISNGDLDTTRAKAIMEPTIINIVKTNDAMQIFRDANVTLIYYYRDKNGNYTMSIPVTPDMYKK